MSHNIFLYFLNEEFLKFVRYFENIDFVQEMIAKERMLQFSLLSSEGQCLVPPSFLMENPNNLNLLLKYEYFFKSQKISLLIKEDSIDKFFEKKEFDYRDVKNEKGYTGYYDQDTKNKIENLYNLSSTRREFSISSQLRDYWENELAEKEQLIGFSGNDAKIILDNDHLISELEAIAYHTEDKAFIWDNIQNKTKEFDETFSKAVWESLLLYYIKAHIEKQNCSIISDNPLFVLNYNKLPQKGLIPYKIIHSTLEDLSFSSNSILSVDNFTDLYHSDTKKQLQKKIKDKKYAEQIHSDLTEDIDGTLYLGTKPNKSEAAENFRLPIYADGLDLDTSQLLLSALPKNSNGMYLTPLKNGLSGANVYAITVILGKDRRRSKTYVAKVGERKKLEIENENYEKYIQQYLPNYSPAIWRRKGEKYALFYEFKRSKNQDKNVSSLKEKILSPTVTCDEIKEFITKSFDSLNEIKKRTFEEVSCKYSKIVNWYTEGFISENKDHNSFNKILSNDIKESLGIDEVNFIEVFHKTNNKISKHIIDVAHGDLHAENIIIGSDKSTWLIDFYWTNETNPIVDYVMLEISIKFACIPPYSDFRILAQYEKNFINQFRDVPLTDFLGYEGVFNIKQIQKAYEAVNHIRDIARKRYKIRWDHYRDILFLMTCGQLTKVRWNMMNIPFIVLSCNLLASKIIKSKKLER